MLPATVVERQPAVRKAAVKPAAIPTMSVRSKLRTYNSEGRCHRRTVTDRVLL